MRTSFFAANAPSSSGPSSCPSARERPLEATTFVAALGFTLLAAAALLAGPTLDLAQDAPLPASVPVTAAAMAVAAEVGR